MCEALKQQFTEALRATNEEAAKLGCYSVVFDDMLSRLGGVETARRLTGTFEIQAGMRNVCALGRPDLSTEAMMLRPEYAKLFKDRERDAARFRLEQMGVSNKQQERLDNPG